MHVVACIDDASRFVIGAHLILDDLPGIDVGMFKGATKRFGMPARIRFHRMSRPMADIRELEEELLEIITIDAEKAGIEVVSVQGDYGSMDDFFIPLTEDGYL